MLHIEDNDELRRALDEFVNEVMYGSEYNGLLIPAVDAVLALLRERSQGAAGQADEGWTPTHDDPACCSINCNIDHSAVQLELQERPFHEDMLAENEMVFFHAINNPLTRHQFHEHDCQSVSCKSLFVYSSSEFSEMLQEQYQRGHTDGLYVGAIRAESEPEDYDLKSYQMSPEARSWQSGPHECGLALARIETLFVGRAPNGYVTLPELRAAIDGTEVEKRVGRNEAANGGTG